MAQIHKISNQKSISQLNNQDVMLVSHTTNPQYCSQWTSNKISILDLAKQIANRLRTEEGEPFFKEELSTLCDISLSYLNNDNLTLHKTADEDHTYLSLSSEWSDDVFGKINVDDFVIDGMLESADLSSVNNKKYLILKFNTAAGSKIISVDMSDLLSEYSFGLSTSGKTVGVDSKTIALKQHQHLSSDITDFPTDVSKFYNDVGYLKEHRSYSDISTGIKLNDYSLTSHNHDSNYLTANSLDILSVNWQNSWSRISASTNGLSANVGKIAYKDKVLTSDIDGYRDTTYEAGNGLSITDKNEIVLTADVSSYNTIKDSLSNDGYSLKVCFRDWTSLK